MNFRLMGMKKQWSIDASLNSNINYKTTHLKLKTFFTTLCHQFHNSLLQNKNNSKITELLSCDNKGSTSF